MADDLTPKQARFVEEYLVDLNATAAAKRAGYSERTARQQGQRLLTNVDIQNAVQKAMDDRSERTRITQDRVLKEYARLGFIDIRRLFTWGEERVHYVPSDQLDEDDAAAISAVKAETTHYEREDGGRETKIKLELKTYDKLGALQKLGKHLGLFNDKLEVTFIDRLKQLAPEDLERIADMSPEEIADAYPELLSG